MLWQSGVRSRYHDFSLALSAPVLWMQPRLARAPSAREMHRSPGRVVVFFVPGWTDRGRLCGARGPSHEEEWPRLRAFALGNICAPRPLFGGAGAEMDPRRTRLLAGSLLLREKKRGLRNIVATVIIGQIYTGKLHFLISLLLREWRRKRKKEKEEASP